VAYLLAVGTHALPCSLFVLVKVFTSNLWPLGLAALHVAEAVGLFTNDLLPRGLASSRFLFRPERKLTYCTCLPRNFH
jgi:hypothetical protein